jgi:hypothetical protein
MSLPYHYGNANDDYAVFSKIRTQREVDAWQRFVRRLADAEKNQKLL